MEIKVIGVGCKNCKKLLENVNAAVKVLNVKADVHYITDMETIAQTGIMRMPGLIINNKIVSYGKVNTIEELKTLIQNHLI